MKKRKIKKIFEDVTSQINEVEPDPQDVVQHKKREPEREDDAQGLDGWQAVAKKELEAKLDVQTNVASYSTSTDLHLEGQGKGNNGESAWVVFENDDLAEAAAIERVTEDLHNEPEIFNQDWLQNYISMSDTDKHMIAVDEAEARLDGESDEDLVEQANLSDKYEELQDQIDRLENQEADLDVVQHDSNEGAITRLQQKQLELVEQAKEAISESIYGEILSQLDDPIQYFVHDMGIYTIDDLMKSSFISIDIDEAAQAAVDEDGVSHFLDVYDSEGVELPSGAVAYGTN